MYEEPQRLHIFLWNGNEGCRGCVQILGNNECFEPYTSNIYVRRVLSGEFTVVNQHLLMDLTRLGLWSPDLKNELVAANGSVQVSTLRTRLVIPAGPLCNELPCLGSISYCQGWRQYWASTKLDPTGCVTSV